MDRFDILKEEGVSDKGIKALKDYLQNRHYMFSQLQTLVLRDRKKQLKKIYQPLTLALEEGQPRDGLDGLKISCYEKVLENYSKLQIVDAAGMGKSTMTKMMFMDLMERTDYIPIYVELRRISFAERLVNEIAVMLMGGPENSLLSDFSKILETGKIVMFLDGFDETGLEIREKVVTAIRDLTDSYPQNHYILTSRPETELTSLRDFKRVSIKPLQKREAFELLTRYDDHGETSRLLVEKLREKEYKAIDDFLKNPLLVSLLFAAFDYKQTVPLKKHLFYSQVYEAFFERHDLSKGDCEHEKKSGLDIFDFDKVLRVLGYNSMMKQKVEFSKDEILALIGQAGLYCADLTFKKEDFLYDLLHSVPLFSKDGILYRWSHKSLQEYFAARFISIDAKGQHEVILSSLYSSDKIDKYINMLDIFYDLDNYEFHRVLTLTFLENYIAYFNKNFLPIEGINDNSIKLRIALLYDRDGYISYKKKKISRQDVLPFIIEEITRFMKETHIMMNQSSGYMIGGLTFCRILHFKKNVAFINLLKSRKVPLFSTTSKDVGFPDEEMRTKEGEFKQIANVHSFAYSQRAYDFGTFCLSTHNDKEETIIDYDKARDFANQIYSMISMKTNMTSIIEII